MRLPRSMERLRVAPSRRPTGIIIIIIAIVIRTNNDTDNNTHISNQTTNNNNDNDIHITSIVIMTFIFIVIINIIITTIIIIIIIIIMSRDLGHARPFFVLRSCMFGFVGFYSIWILSSKGWNPPTPQAIRPEGS